MSALLTARHQARCPSPCGARYVCWHDLRQCCLCPRLVRYTSFGEPHAHFGKGFQIYKNAKISVALSRMRRSRRAYHGAMLEEFASTFDFNGVAVSEEQRARNAKVNWALVFVFTHKSNVACSMLNADDEDVQQHQRTKRRRDYAVEDICDE